MKKYKAVIWDMDGTILDTLTDLMDSVNATLEKYSLPCRTYEQIRKSVGNGVRVLIGLSVPGGESHVQFEEIFADFKLHYASNCRNKTKPYERITSVMKKLSDAGMKNAVVSNKVDSAVKELAADFFPDLDFALGETQGLARKPAPDMVFEALRALGVTQSESVYIGDSEVDMETAKNSGLDCISVLWGFRTKNELLEKGATVFAETPEDILKLLI